MGNTQPRENIEEITERMFDSVSKMGNKTTGEIGNYLKLLTFSNWHGSCFLELARRKT